MPHCGAPGHGSETNEWCGVCFLYTPRERQLLNEIYQLKKKGLKMHEPCERLIEAMEEIEDLRQKNGELSGLLEGEHEAAAQWRRHYIEADRKYWEVKAKMDEREPNGCKDCSAVADLLAEVDKLQKQSDSWAAEANLLKVRLQDSQNALKEVEQIIRGAAG